VQIVIGVLILNFVTCLDNARVAGKSHLALISGHKCEVRQCEVQGDLERIDPIT
jgi:hypothetical protein